MTTNDWRHDTLDRIRDLIVGVDPEIVEEAKWAKASNPDGVPTWSRRGNICTGEIYKDKVKVTFFQGAALTDPSGLFNSSLDGKVRRAIDIHHPDDLDADAFQDLVREAVGLNAG